MRLGRVTRLVHRQVSDRSRHMLPRGYLAPCLARMLLRARRQAHGDFVEPSEINVSVLVLLLVLRIFHILCHTYMPLIRLRFVPTLFLCHSLSSLYPDIKPTLYVLPKAFLHSQNKLSCIASTCFFFAFLGDRRAAQVAQ